MKFGNLFRSLTDSKTKFPWLLKHGRAYYASFYFVTGVALILWAIGFFVGSTVVTGISFGVPFAAAFLVLGVTMFYLGATVSKENSRKRWRTRIKKFALGSIALLALARGITAASLAPYGLAFALVTPIWVAFVILWAAPLIWYLPTELDEFLSLRARLDEAEEETDSLKRELRKLKVERLQADLREARKKA